MQQILPSPSCRTKRVVYRWPKFHTKNSRVLCRLDYIKCCSAAGRKTWVLRAMQTSSQKSKEITRLCSEEQCQPRQQRKASLVLTWHTPRRSNDHGDVFVTRNNTYLEKELDLPEKRNSLVRGIQRKVAKRMWRCRNCRGGYGEVGGLHWPRQQSMVG